MPRSAKGSSFERLICRTLSIWWSEGERDDIFWRSAGSGAMAKTRSKMGKSTFGQYGDIQSVDPIGQPLIDVFTMELKRGYNRTTIADMLDKPTEAGVQEWEKFYQQVREDKKNAKSVSWMIVTKRDRREPLISIPRHMMLNLREKGAKLQNIPHLSGRVLLKNTKKMSIFLCRFSDFFEIIKREHIEAIKDESTRLIQTDSRTGSIQQETGVGSSKQRQTLHMQKVQKKNS